LKLRTSIEVSGWNYETEKRGWNYEAGSGSFDDQHGVLGDLIPPFLGHFLTQIFSSLLDKGLELRRTFDERRWIFEVNLATFNMQVRG